MIKTKKEGCLDISKQMFMVEAKEGKRGVGKA
jgi:hypothetical protein